MRKPKHDQSVEEVLGRALSGAVASFMEHEASARHGDMEGLHQARVATRRMRSDLRTFRAYLDPQWASELRGELRWFGAELGAVRDLDVMLDHLTADAHDLPELEREGAERVLHRLVADREAARADLYRSFDTPRFRVLREELSNVARRPLVAYPAAQEPAAQPLRALVAKSYRSVKRSVAELGPTPSDGALHAVRIRAKRCRYAADAAAPVWGKPARRLARGMASVQQSLGRHQDAVVARAWLEKTASELNGADAYAVGMLAQVEVEAADAAREEFTVAWSKARDKRRRDWL